MKGENRHFRHSKLSERKFRSIMRLFALDLTATQCAGLAGISLRSVNSIYLRIRVRMSEFCAQHSPLYGELEADESYFGPRRVRGRRAEGPLERRLSPLKRGDCVYTEIIPDATKATLQAIIRGKADIRSVNPYRRLTRLSRAGRHRLRQTLPNEFARGKQHINSIKSFWSFAKATPLNCT